MALTIDEERRLAAIELALTGVQTAIDNLASKKQLRELTTLRQADVNDLQTRVAALETQMTSLQTAVTLLQTDVATLQGLH